MQTFHFHCEQTIPEDVPRVFDFFADAANLAVLTPPWLEFRIRTPMPISMEEGARIDYGLKLRGVPIRWSSRITSWDPPHRFVDEQIRGPYRRWTHEHRFEETESGTQVTDSVRYAVWGGSVVDRLLVRPDLERIFRFRRERLAARFAAMPGTGVNPCGR